MSMNMSLVIECLVNEGKLLECHMLSILSTFRYLLVDMFDNDQFQEINRYHPPRYSLEYAYMSRHRRKHTRLRQLFVIVSTNFPQNNNLKMI